MRSRINDNDGYATGDVKLVRRFLYFPTYLWCNGEYKSGIQWRWLEWADIKMEYDDFLGWVGKEWLNE